MALVSILSFSLIILSTDSASTRHRIKCGGKIAWSCGSSRVNKKVNTSLLRTLVWVCTFLSNYEGSEIENLDVSYVSLSLCETLSGENLLQNHFCFRKNNSSIR